MSSDEVRLARNAKRAKDSHCAAQSQYEKNKKKKRLKSSFCSLKERVEEAKKARRATKQFRRLTG